jgi:hypothetical protein
MDGNPAKHMQADNFVFQSPSTGSIKNLRLRHDYRYIKPKTKLFFLFSTPTHPETTKDDRRHIQEQRAPTGSLRIICTTDDRGGG